MKITIEGTVEEIAQMGVPGMQPLNVVKSAMEGGLVIDGDTL
ncbi:MAG: hypothetical protein R3E55_16280 [Burkholderiaceae bacterium]